MAKIFLLILVLFFVFWLFFVQRKRPADGKGQQSPKDAEKIVICARCRLHVPESESIFFEGHHYCCDEHRRLGAS